VISVSCFRESVSVTPMSVSEELLSFCVMVAL